MKLSKFHSLLSTRLALKWPSVAARVFIQKLNLLFKVTSGEESIGYHVFSSIAANNLQSLRLIQECRSLEDKLVCCGVLHSKASLKELKKNILKVDGDTCVSTASQHSSAALAASVSSNVSWLKLWDMALDYGPRGTAALQALYCTLTKPRFGQNICSTCDIELDESYFEHYTLCHTPIRNPQLIVDSLTREGNEIFDYARHFL